MSTRLYTLMVGSYLTVLLLVLSVLSFMVCADNERPMKIVGLVAARNESSIIEPCLRAMAAYTDAIVVLDDVSSDHTVEVVESLRDECRIVKIIAKKVWIRDERADKQALLDAGREAGGTHFLLLDADEMFTACCLKANWLRSKIAAMQPGQIMMFPMMNVWDGVEYYRDDDLCNPRSWKWSGITGVLCDDGLCDYSENPAWGPSGSMHISRAPANRIRGDYPPNIKIADLNYGLLHYKSVNLQDIEAKKIWYMILEFIRVMQENADTLTAQERAAKINSFYRQEFASMLCDWSTVKLSSVPTAWIDYSWFDASYFSRGNPYRKADIVHWLRTYGTDYFKHLAIWDIPWIHDYVS